MPETGGVRVKSHKSRTPPKSTHPHIPKRNKRIFKKPLDKRLPIPYTMLVTERKEMK